MPSPACRSSCAAILIHRVWRRAIPRKRPMATVSCSTFSGRQNHPGSFVTLDDTCANNDLAMTNTGRTDELDYILVRPNGAALETEWNRLIFRHADWDGPKGHQSLSYRYAV